MNRLSICLGYLLGKGHGLPKSDIFTPLLSFNLGVEAGQIIVLSAVFCMVIVVKRAAHNFERYQSQGQYYLAQGVGSLAAFWVLQRMLV